MAGSLSCLNVTGGDIKITFDKNVLQESIRAKRIVEDMLKRGYALLVEVEGAYQRAIGFDPEKCEYIIADYAPVEASDGQVKTPKETEETTPAPRRRGRKRLPLAKTNAVGIARSAGG